MHIRFEPETQAGSHLKEKKKQELIKTRNLHWRSHSGRIQHRYSYSQKLSGPLTSPGSNGAIILG